MVGVGRQEMVRDQSVHTCTWVDRDSVLFREIANAGVHIDVWFSLGIITIRTFAILLIIKAIACWFGLLSLLLQYKSKMEATFIRDLAIGQDWSQLNLLSTVLVVCTIFTSKELELARQRDNCILPAGTN
ncbi:hypothetical protein EDD17DRAFT_1513296 [Pisolithus thermaeus]|nr:hypothetical protein EDD17DRAFT_1513296 [Pisolithus thermaeus]